MARATAAMSWMVSQLLQLQPGTKNGGIVGNGYGYHNSRDSHRANRPNDYSIQDAIDQQGPGDAASACDWTFPDAQSSRYENIAKYTSRVIASAKDPNDPRLDGWREIYGQADGDLQVEGWDFRNGVPASSDSSHLWHIHLSESRAYTEDWTNKHKMLSVLRGETIEEWNRSQGIEPAEDFSTYWYDDTESNG